MINHRNGVVAQIPEPVEEDQMNGELSPHPSSSQILLDLTHSVGLVVEYARCKTRIRPIDKRVIDMIHRADAA